jgi:hypothetical protein
VTGKRNKQNLLPPWKPGVCPNPAGRPPLPPEVKEARRLTKTEFESIVNKYLFAPIAELERLKSDKSLVAIEAWMVAIIYKGLTAGDWAGNEWIQQRLLGKVKDQLEVSTPKPFVLRYRDGETVEMGADVKKLPGGEKDGSE